MVAASTGPIAIVRSRLGVFDLPSKVFCMMKVSQNRFSILRSIKMTTERRYVALSGLRGGGSQGHQESAPWGLSAECPRASCRSASCEERCRSTGDHRQARVDTSAASEVQKSATAIGPRNGEWGDALSFRDALPATRGSSWRPNELNISIFVGYRGRWNWREGQTKVKHFYTAKAEKGTRVAV